MLRISGQLASRRQDMPPVRLLLEVPFLHQLPRDVVRKVYAGQQTDSVPVRLGSIERE